MKNKQIIFAGLMIITFLLVSCTGNGAQNTAGESGAAVNLVLDSALPDVPQTMMSYKIVPPNVSVESVAALGALLGFTGEAGPINPGMIGMSNPKKREMLQVTIATGTIEYTCSDALFAMSSDLPEDDEAVGIAAAFLKDIGLWHSDLSDGEVVVGGSSGSSPTHLLVRFTRYIGDFPVTGPGNKFAVRIGDKGKVVQLFARYDKLEQDKEVQIIDATAAYNRLKAGDGIFTLPMEYSTVKITDVSLGYYLESVSETQEYLMPFYIFKGECLDTSGSVLEEFTGWVDAASG